MSKLPPFKPKEIEKLLIRNGFRLIHQKGSHRNYFNPVTKNHVTVPYHSREIPKGTSASIIRQSGINRDRFIELLKNV